MLLLSLSVGCADPEGEAADGSVDAAPMVGPSLDASSSDASLGPASCDLSGLWIGRMNTESMALGVPQYANNWYYYEFAQQGDLLTVSRHIDCGIEVRGSVRVVLAPATSAALTKHNVQTSRKATVRAHGDGTCDLSMEKFWSVRGVDEQRYLPSPRVADVSLTSLRASNPLPPAKSPELSEDWDGDDKPGITWVVTGIVAGTRATAQRDWTRYFTAPGYPITAASDFGDQVIRAEFDGEEVVYEADLGLNQLSQPVSAAEHTLTLRFLGRAAGDARAEAVLGVDDSSTCANIRSALPSTQGLR